MAINNNDLTSIHKVGEDLTEATGTFDRMMLAVRAQLKDAVDNQEITQAEAGVALAQSVGPIMSNAVQFELSREKTDAETTQIKRNTI